MTRNSLAAALAALTLGAVPALAQNANVNANNLVNVNISDVANEIAENLSVNVEDVPVTVQAPIGIAATVCGVAANVLASDNKSGEAACDATSTSQALNQIVQGEMGS